jgi:small subunit ribosomal protein S3Ae
MAIGKNKKLGKSKKGGKKKTADAFSKKEWYDIRVPGVFPAKTVGKTVVTKTIGTKIAKDSLMGREFEISLGDLKENCEDEAFRKFRLKVEDVQGNNCLTNFHGMDLTTDKLRSLVRKWQSLIEAYVDVRTTDGYSLRLFCIGFTKRRPNQARKTSYAQSAQVRAIRKKMIDIMQKESNVELTQLVEKLMSEHIGHEIEKHTQAIYPLQNVLIRKVKMLRSAKVEASKLLEMHGGLDALTAAPAAAAASADVGTKVEETKAEEKKEEKKAEKPAEKKAPAEKKKAAK